MKSGGKELALELEEQGLRLGTSAAGAEPAGASGVTAPMIEREPDGIVRRGVRRAGVEPRRRRRGWSRCAARRSSASRRSASRRRRTRTGTTPASRQSPMQEFALAHGAQRRRAVATSSRRSQFGGRAGTRWCSSTAASRPSYRTLGALPAGVSRPGSRRVVDDRSELLERIGRSLALRVARVHGAQHGLHVRRRGDATIAKRHRSARSRST